MWKQNKCQQFSAASLFFLFACYFLFGTKKTEMKVEESEIKTRWINKKRIGSEQTWKRERSFRQDFFEKMAKSSEKKGKIDITYRQMSFLKKSIYFLIMCFTRGAKKNCFKFFFSIILFGWNDRWSWMKEDENKVWWTRTFGEKSPSKQKVR